MAVEGAVRLEKDLHFGQIQEICKEHEGRKGDLLIVLQKIQAVLGYFPQWAIGMVADALGGNHERNFLGSSPFTIGST